MGKQNKTYFVLRPQLTLQCWLNFTGFSRSAALLSVYVCLDLSGILPSALDRNELCKSLVLEHGEVWCKQNIVQVVGLNCYISKRKETQKLFCCCLVWFFVPLEFVWAKWECIEILGCSVRK